MKKTLIIFLAAIIYTSLGITFAQEFPNDGDIRTLTSTGTISKIADGCDPYGAYAFYAGSDVFFLVYSEQLKADNYGILKSSHARKYGNIFDDSLKIPFTSSVQPKNGTANTPSNKVIVAKANGGKFTIPNNYSTPRNEIAGQLVTNTEYRLLRSTNPLKSYFFTNFLETKNQMQASANFSQNAAWKKACVSYYVARCGDGIVDKASGDLTTNGQGGIITKDDGFKSWHSTSIKPNEVCDDGALNGQAGKCKTDCSGLGGDTPTGNLTVTKTLVSDKNYSQGENLQFKINFANNTTQTIQNITIEDLLPAGFEYISSEITGATAPISFSTGMVQGNFRIAYTGFSLSAGQAGYILINAKLTSCAAALNNVYWAGTFNGQSVTGYTNKQVTCSNTPVSITKSVAKTSVSGGESVLFTIQANNATPNAITNIFLQDIWPTNGCVFLTGNVQANLPVSQTQNGNMTQWTIPSLAAGQSITLTFYGQTKADASCVGTHTNTAKILYTDPSGNQQTQATATLTIAQPTQQMTIDKVVTQYGYGPKDMVVFEIKYKNTSSTPIYGFKITDIWPDSLDFVSADPRPTNTTQRPILRDFSSKTLQPQEGGVIKITGQIKSNIR